MPTVDADALTPSERDWLAVRGHLERHRHELAVAAAADYPDHPKVAGTPLLAASNWLPSRPLPLAAVDLELVPDRAFGGVTGTGESAHGVLPLLAGGSRYARYSDVYQRLAAPRVFENRSTYRLLAADLSGPRARLVFGHGSYFDSIDVGEASAHEYAARETGGGALRRAIGDPCDLRNRPANLAISTLTLRHDRAIDAMTFFLHWRDPAKVGHAGGLYQVVPVGVFQASGEAEWNQGNDFSLWRSMIREFAEELGGRSEDYGSDHAPIDYASWPLANKLTEGLESGEVQAWCLGLGVDPLTFATDLLTAVVIEASLFDDLFGEVAGDNDEGRVLAAEHFTTGRVRELLEREPFQAAGAAVLTAAARHFLE